MAESTLLKKSVSEARFPKSITWQGFRCRWVIKGVLSDEKERKKQHRGKKS
jgi:hypothetical protein